SPPRLVNAAASPARAREAAQPRPASCPDNPRARSPRKVVPVQQHVPDEAEIRDVQIPVERIEGEQDHPPLPHRQIEDGRLAVDRVLAAYEAGEHEATVLRLGLLHRLAFRFRVEILYFDAARLRRRFSVLLLVLPLRLL